MDLVYDLRRSIVRRSNLDGRDLLAGDSAHQYSSAVAQCQNQGLYDAVNLSWKSTLVLREHAAESLLETHTEERLTVAKQ